MTPRRALLFLLAALLGGCLDDRSTDPVLEARVFNALGGLKPGQALTLAGEDAREILLSGANGGAEYLYVPFLADSADARLSVTLVGTGIERSIAGPTPALAAAPAPGPLSSRNAEWATGEDERWHTARLAAGERRFSHHPGAARTARAATGAARKLSAPRPLVPPSVGATLAIRVPEFDSGSPCERFSERSGRVMAVGKGAVIVSDLSNPPRGFSTFDFERFSERFDNLVGPSDTLTFGAPTDLDGNGRVVIFFTRAVNEETPPGARSYVGGFFWVGDLLPVSACPQSNGGELFYLIVPDPDGLVNGNRFSTTFVRSITLATIGHELEHLINAGRHIYVNGAENLEEVWLDEGLAHIAEELIFYRASGVAPRQNIDLERILSTTAVKSAMNEYQLSNMLRYIEFLRDPSGSAIAAGDALGSRGASWSFLRYAADRRKGDDRAFFHALVNSTTRGLPNLAHELGADPMEWMHDWNVAVFTDDMGVPTEERFSQPSWNFRSVIPPLRTGRDYPLEVLQPGPNERLQVRLTGTGTAFMRVIAPAGKMAKVTETPGSNASKFRVTVVRIR